MPFLSSPSLGASAGLPPSPTVLTTRIVPPTVAYAILGIEAMAVEIENPFGYDFNDLPLGILCDEIAMNIREILDRHHHPHFLEVMAGQTAAWS